MKRILSLLKEKWPEYILEILVITIGILGAFALNNWNEDRNSKSREVLYLQAINTEFKNNRTQFQQITGWHRISREALRGILKEYEKSQPNADSLRLYASKAWATFTFDPSQSSIQSILSASSLDIIQNQELRSLLVNWSDLVADYQDEEVTTVTYFFDHIRPYLESHMKHSQSLEKEELVFGESMDLTLENMIRNRITDLNYILENIYLENSYPENEKVRKAMDRIIELSEQK